MNVDYYAARLEQAVGNPDQLEQVADDVERDQNLAPDDRSAILGRAGMYLADHGRSTGVPYDDGSDDGAAGASS